MDANQTRFQLLLGFPDWSACQDSQLGIPLGAEWASIPHSSQLEWDHERQELILRPRLFKFRPAPKDNAPGLDDRRGAGCDRYGNWYWIDASRQQVLVNSSGSGATTLFWPIQQEAAPAPDRSGSFRQRDLAPQPAVQLFSGLAVTEDHYLVVGLLQPPGLLIFDLHAGGPPQTLAWPKGAEFVPFDMSPRPGGGVWILDRQNRRLWGLDRRFNPDGPSPSSPSPDAFQSLAEGAIHSSAPLSFPSGFSMEFSSPIDAHDPVSVETLPDDSVLVLDRLDGSGLSPVECYSTIALYRCGQQLGQPVSLQVVADLVETAEGEVFCLRGHDLAFVPEHTTAEGEQQLDRIYVVSSSGNQSFAFNISLAQASPADGDQLTIQPVGEYYPMRLFGGSGLVAAGNQPYYDFSNGKSAPVRWVPLVAQPRPRFTESGALDTFIDASNDPAGRPAFDGRVPDCVWHRLDLEGCIPPQTGVQVWSRAANTQSELAQAQWRPEPPLYLRREGSEQPFAGQAAQVPGTGTWELLLQKARGRYLQLRMQLSGNGRSTPRLRALRVYYPRFSYRADPLSSDFLDRFLANFEGFFTATEDRIAAAQVLLDLRTVPPEALDWLASFYGVVFDPAWNKVQQWLLFKYAMQLFQYRGTVRGLQMVLYLALNAAPDEAVLARVFSSDPAEASRTLELCGVRIVERFRTRLAPAAVFGDPSSVGTTLGGGPAGAAAFKPPASWQLASGEIGYLPALNQAGVLDPVSIQSAWQGFLLRRYRQVGQLNRAHGSYWGRFDAIPLPQFLPFIGSLTRDWYLFETAVLGMYRTAHRFTVMLPASRDLEADSPEHQQRLDLVRRIVELEKPAHTIFDVRFYWAMFRLGEARLGLDTLVDLGGRNPQLMPGMILGQGHLSEGALAPGHPQNVKDRSVLGRDRLASGPVPLLGASLDPHQKQEGSHE